MYLNNSFFMYMPPRRDILKKNFKVLQTIQPKKPIQQPRKAFLGERAKTPIFLLIKLSTPFTNKIGIL
jgi:hypothetical protein